MKNKLMFATAALAGALYVTPAFAVPSHEDECAIWLCATNGFKDDGCDKAKEAARWRTHRHKPVLPRFESCAVDDGNSSKGNNMSASEQYVIRIEAHDECTEWNEISTDHGKPSRQCLKWKHIPQHYEPGVSCTKDMSKGRDFNLSDLVKIEGCSGVWKKVTIMQNKLPISIFYLDLKTNFVSSFHQD